MGHCRPPVGQALPVARLAMATGQSPLAGAHPAESSISTAAVAAGRYASSDDTATATCWMTIGETMTMPVEQG
jgi:hypothetical protein